jgi:hypothetical protein
MRTGIVLGVIATVLAGVLGGGAADAKMPLAATVDWSDGTASGSAQFDGFVDGEELRGVVKIADEYLRVLGAVAEDGSVTGTLSVASGEVGTFSGTLVGDVLTGDLAVNGALACEWEAPSSEAIMSELP